MTFSGHIHNGVVILDETTDLPDGTPVRVEAMNAPQKVGDEQPRRQGGQYAGQIWLAPDFDEWPPDLQESLGMTP